MDMAFAIGVVTASGPSLADWLTAAGTVALALVTVVTLIVTVGITRADRRHDDKVRAEDRALAEKVLADERDRAAQDRAEANRRLREEREAADRRLREERDHAEQVRLHERRADAVARLLERIAATHDYLMIVPSLNAHDAEREPRKVIPLAAAKEAWNAVRSLQEGERTAASMLGHPGAAAQYRALSHLVTTAALGVVPNKDRERATVDLSRYATFVRCSLRHLVDTGDILDPGSPPHPVLTRPSGPEAWYPQHRPAGYVEEIQQTDPTDPLFRPAL